MEKLRGGLTVHAALAVPSRDSSELVFQALATSSKEKALHPTSLPSIGADSAGTSTHAEWLRCSRWTRARNAPPHGDSQPGVVQQVRCLCQACSKGALQAMRWGSTLDFLCPADQEVAPRAAAEGLPRTHRPAICALHALGDEIRARDPAEPGMRLWPRGR